MARDPEADGPMTSGMVALIPTTEDAARLALAGGEAPERLHVTLAYLGDDVTTWPMDVATAMDAWVREIGRASCRERVSRCV